MAEAKQDIEEIDTSEIITNGPRTSSSDVGNHLTEEQIKRMENNRKRALEIKNKKEESVAKVAKLAMSHSISSKPIDTGAGFYLDEEDLIDEQFEEPKLVETPPVPPQDQQLTCQKCNERFPYSFLSIKFDLKVCDSCRTKYTDEYKLITRTEAKAEYLLKDCDFDAREPPLKFIEKRNPHRNKYGNMKLYLKFQCEERAMVVHEDHEKLEEKKEIKILNLHKTRQKNYEKKLKDLRKDAYRGAIKLTKFHEHEYGEEMYNEEDDVYFTICKTCEHKNEYEKI